ncbi:MAG: tRNA threonylcarbamoyladenosine dehydratase [Planctomycetota bacterium]|nr:tRNA threonylcarbamoyladenosine dehydratase [Planctomycetota bacterium]
MERADVMNGSPAGTAADNCPTRDATGDPPASPTTGAGAGPDQAGRYVPCPRRSEAAKTVPDAAGISPDPTTGDAERFARLAMMVGCEGMRRLAASSVTVVGLGAVGSYAVEALARAGIGRLRLVDFDIVRPANTNRQLYALQSTMGRLKAEVARDRVRDINPGCEAEAITAFAHSDTADLILAGPPDVLVDAIDSVGPKVELLATAVARGIRVVSCMGAAIRTDPSMVRTGPLSETRVCPLAKHVRARLKARGIPTDRIACVYSVEPVQGLPPEARGASAATETEFLKRGRARRQLGSLPTLTGIFGLVAANEVLRILLGELFPGRKRASDARLR